MTSQHLCPNLQEILLIKSTYFYSIVTGSPAHSEISLVWNPAFHNSALDIRSNTFSSPHTASNCFSHGWKVVVSFLLRTRWTPTGPTQTNILIHEQRDGAIKSCAMKELCLRDGEVGGCGRVFFLLKGWKGIMEEKGMKKAGKGKGRHKKRERWRLWFIWLLNDDSPCGESPSRCPSAVSEINGGNRKVTYTHSRMNTQRHQLKSWANVEVNKHMHVSNTPCWAELLNVL